MVLEMLFLSEPLKHRIPMAIIFDNIIFNQQRSGGVSRFWSKIIEPYIYDNNARFIEGAGCLNNIYRQSLSIAPEACEPDHCLPAKISRYLNFSRRFFDDDFLFHSSYFRVNDAPGCINITTVHDLMYEKFNSGFGATLHLSQKVVALHKSNCIVCVSEHTRKDLIEHYPFCLDKRIVVIPNGVEGFYPPPVNSELFHRFCVDASKPYFLYIGYRGGCKGFNLVFDALDFLEGSMQCVVVGDPFTQNEFKKIVEMGHKKNILNVGKVSDADLNDLYGHASFLFFPSLYEGFGIPPLEAMMAGCPVLASNRSSVPEVIGGAGILFDPSDLAALKSGLMRILLDDVRRELIAAGTQRARNFSWKSVIERYATLYSELR